MALKQPELAASRFPGMRPAESECMSMHIPAGSNVQGLPSLFNARGSWRPVSHRRADRRACPVPLIFQLALFVRCAPHGASCSLRVVAGHLHPRGQAPGSRPRRCSSGLRCHAFIPHPEWRPPTFSNLCGARRCAANIGVAMVPSPTKGGLDPKARPSSTLSTHSFGRRGLNRAVLFVPSGCHPASPRAKR